MAIEYKHKSQFFMKIIPLFNFFETVLLQMKLFILSER